MSKQTGCSWGTLRIPREDWGTLGSIREDKGNHHPPLKNPIIEKVTLNRITLDDEKNQHGLMGEKTPEV